MEGIHLYNILVLTNQETPFRPLIEDLKKDFFNVYQYGVDYIKFQADDIQNYDFVLLHINPKSAQCIEHISDLRSLSKSPVYLFSEGASDEEMASFMEYGAEGHVCIPFSARVVSARIKAVLRYLNQIRKEQVGMVKIGHIIFHIDNREVIVHGKPIQLTNVEYRILKILVENKDMVISKDKIIHYVWDEDSSATDNALGIHITRLRKKLELQNRSNVIETIWGLGFRLNIRNNEFKETAYKKLAIE